ncbi:MAG: DUF4876 domain-containing protein [Candidatus Cryptobacteroides sp.]
MKRNLIMMLAAAVMMAVSCEKNDGPKTAEVSICLQKDGAALAVEGLTVSLRDIGGTASYEALTDAAGVALFVIPSGNYEASVSSKIVEDGNVKNFNGVNSSISVIAGAPVSFNLAVVESDASQVIIKELYVGGCPKDDGSGVYQVDNYVILYNNSDVEADASDVCFAFATPFNSYGTNKYITDGVLMYEPQGWLPAGYAIWWFQKGTSVKIAPYSQIVIAINGAIDHTATYSQSVDLSNADYAMYDIESGFKNATSYPAPSESIPQSNYLKSYLYGMGNAWPLSKIAPAFYIFRDANCEAFAKDATNYDYTESQTLPVTKVAQDKVIDAIEVFAIGKEDANKKRLPANIDAGYVMFLNKLGYSLYRNVDKEATEAIEGNADKLVYNYAGGTEITTGQSTDPSGIDAEASIAKGAKIIYLDTNNSTKDFHQRAKASLRK